MGSWAQVESNYQRRNDLIPNLVKAVRGFAKHERTVLTEVTEKRADSMAVERAISDLLKSRDEAAELTQGAKEKLTDEGYMKTLATAQQHVGTKMVHLLALVENYPELRASENFLTLQDQLEGTENRINIARMAFNENVRVYNAAIRRMPANLIAGLSGFNDALRYCNEAIEKQPNYSVPYEIRADLYEKMGRYEDSRRDRDRYNKLNPEQR